MIRIGLVVVGKDAADLRGFALDHVVPVVRDLVLVNNSITPRGYGVIGNAYLDRLDVDVMGLCHADTGFGPGAIEAFAEVATGGLLSGIVGKGLGTGYHWSNGDGDGPGPVSTLDSSSLFVRPDLGIRFDAATFDSFHCCVEDFCLSAQERGIGAHVPAANASHRGQSTLQPDWQAAYWHYRAVLATKWQGRAFETT